MTAKEALWRIETIDRNEATKRFWDELRRLVDVEKIPPEFEDDPDGFEINIGQVASFRVSARKNGYRPHRWSHFKGINDPSPMANEKAAAVVFDEILDFVTTPVAA